MSESAVASRQALNPRRAHGRVLAGAVAAVMVAASPAAGQGSPSPAGRGPQGRPVSDQDRALGERARGEIRPLGELLTSAQRVGRGSYLGVETGSHVYRFKFRRAGGEVVWVDMDSRSGEVVGVRD